MSNNEITGEIQNIVFHNEDNGFTVLKIKRTASTVPFTAVGSFTNISVRAGQRVKVYGAWAKHPEFGRQFQIERSVVLRPDSVEGITRYLCSGFLPQVGEKTAEKIVEHFGLDTLDILEKAPQRLAEISTIGKKKLRLIRDSLQKKTLLSDITMFLSNLNISGMTAKKIIECYGSETINIISANPFQLASEISGIGFVKADEIAHKVGIAKDSPERIQAAIIYALKQAEDRGHCYERHDRLFATLMQLLKLTHNQLEPHFLDCIQVLSKSGYIINETISDDDLKPAEIHFLKDLKIAEEIVATYIKQMLKSPLSVDQYKIEHWLKHYNNNSAALSAAQLAAVKMAVTNRVFILTGGPGVGKTTTANTIIKLLLSLQKSVALCAPTGRAAQRLHEVTSIPAKTIHRLLEWAPNDFTFLRDELNPIKADVIIVDEASMLDIRLTAALLRAITPQRTQIIFIGDVDQLPSVGPGNVLRDLILSNRVPYQKLTEIFRQASESQIIQTAHAINHGGAPEFLNVAESDCRFIEISQPDQIISMIKHLLVDKLPKLRGFDASKDIQILTPMNKGDLGTLRLNEEIQNLLNPEQNDMRYFKKGNHKFKVDDKIIQVSNNYELQVFNGDIGFIKQIGVDNNRILVSFADKDVFYTAEQALDLQLAYAITIHKSQGSEFPVVIIPITMMHYIMLQRNLIYTALTRAKKLAIFIGTRKALNFAVQQQSSTTRQTCLADRLCQVN